MTATKVHVRPLRVFISYAAADSAEANRLRHVLQRQVPVRIFTRETLSAGEDWASQLKSELADCDLFIALLSPDSVQSSWVLYELGAAWGLGKTALLIATQPEVLAALPLDISQAQVIQTSDLDNPDVIAGVLDRVAQDRLPTRSSA